MKTDPSAASPNCSDFVPAAFLRFRRQNVLLGLLLIAVVAFAYWPTLFLGWFPLDDALFIGSNPALTKPSGWQTIWSEPKQNPHYYPLLISVFRLLRQFFGLDPLPFHAANLFLHAVASLCLWRLLAFFGFRLAWFAAAIWAVHPLNVQTVGWITEMKNTLSTAFYFASLWALARGWNAKSIIGWWVVSFLLFAAAMLSKSTSVSLLLAAVLLTWAADLRWSPRHIAGFVPFLLFGVLFALFSWSIEKGFSAQTPGQSFTFAQCLISSGKGLFSYLAKVFWPFDLTFVYPRFDLSASDWRNYVPVVSWVSGLGVLIALARRTGQRWPAASMLFFTVVVGALPFVGIAFVKVFSDVTDHFVYLPIAAPIALAVCGAATLAGTKRFALVAFSAVVACAFLTHRQSAVFGSAEFWRRAISAVPQVGPHHGWYAFRLIEEGQIEKGKSVALDLLSKQPDLQSALLAAGIAAVRGEKPREALPHLRRLAEQPGGTMPEPVRWSLYANGLLIAGEPRQAALILEDLRMKRTLPLLGYLDLARSYLDLGLREQALAIYNESLRIDPRGTRANEQMAVALAEIGHLESALARARLAVASSPRSVSARVNLAKMLSATGDHASALSLIADMRRDTPDDLRLQFEQANLLQAAGRDDEAANEYEAVLEADKANIDAANNLAWLKISSGDPAVRDPERAVELARSAADMARDSQRTEILHLCLGTLSRALKASGRNEEAVGAALEAKQAAEKSGDKTFVEGLRFDGLLPAR